MTKVIANVTNEFIYKMYSYNFASTCKLNTLRSGIILQVFHGQKVVNKANTVSLTCTMRKQNNVFFLFSPKRKIAINDYTWPRSGIIIHTLPCHNCFFNCNFLYHSHNSIVHCLQYFPANEVSLKPMEEAYFIVKYWTLARVGEHAAN